MDTGVPLSVVDGTLPQVMMTRETMARCAIPAMPLKELELDPCLASGVGPHLPAPHPFGVRRLDQALMVELSDEFGDRKIFRPPT